MDSIIATPYGRVQGRVDAGVHTFLGVPYAAPPFGANRLRRRDRSSRGAASATRSPSERSHRS